MPSFLAISPVQLSRLVGLPKCPVLLDVRVAGHFDADPRLLPGSIRRSHSEAPVWAPAYAGQRVVAVCQQGRKLAEGAAAWLRHSGAEAEILEGGFAAWAEAGLPLVPAARLPERDAAGRTLWVTRSRPKIDRIACPWLIRRFVDPAAIFLFVSPAEVPGVAEHFGATPFDIEGVHWSHRDGNCTFDTMIEEWGLGTEALLRLATIVRGADTAQLGLAPECAGLLAASLGLSRMYADDLSQLEAGLLLYDAFYRWCRDATDETHHWPTNKSGGAR